MTKEQATDALAEILQTVSKEADKEKTIDRNWLKSAIETIACDFNDLANEIEEGAQIAPDATLIETIDGLAKSLEKNRSVATFFELCALVEAAAQLIENRYRFKNAIEARAFCWEARSLARSHQDDSYRARVAAWKSNISSPLGIKTKNATETVDDLFARYDFFGNAIGKLLAACDRIKFSIQSLLSCSQTRDGGRK